MNYERRRSERIGYEKQIYKQHCERIANARPTINTRSIQKLKPIPRYVIENRIRENKINMENMELLLRLANIKSSIQSHNHISVLRQLKIKQQIYKIGQKLKKQRIDIENKKLAQTIQNVKPSICMKKLEYEYKKTRDKIKLLSLYPEFIS